MGRMSTTNDTRDWRVEEAYNLIGGIAQLAPEVLRQIFRSRTSTRWLRQPSGLIEPAHTIHADGPALKALMTVFAAKLGMALFREHVGKPLPVNGGVYTQFYFNTGLDRASAERMLSIMPMHDTLIQGKVQANEQFAYRYNCDERSIFGALIGFHGALHVRTFAMANTEPYAFLLKEHNVDLVRPGELAERVANAVARADPVRPQVAT